MEPNPLNQHIEYLGDLNLENYVPVRRGYNTITYMHKRHVHKDQNNIADKVIQKESDAGTDQKNDKNKKRKWKLTKQQKPSEIETIAKSENKMKGDKTDEFQPTTKIPRNVIPLIVPPSLRCESPTKLLYTIKTYKSKKKNKQDYNTVENQIIIEKKKVKDIKETFRKSPVRIQKEYSSAKESVSSRSNTLDELNLNHILSCSVSEISDKKLNKRDRSHDNNRQTSDKVAVSHSFEALATEMIDNENVNKKIKIHLMNDRERQLLCESIQNPIVTVVRDAVADLADSKHDLSNELKNINRSIMSNTKKLNTILEKIVKIENRLGILECQKIVSTNDKIIKVIKSPKSRRQMKPSKLEELSEDIECKDETSSEEILHQEYLDQKNYFERKNAASVSVLSPIRSENIESEKVVNERVTSWENTNSNVCNQGQGEDPLVPFTSSSSGHVAMHDRPNRVPARFCWTDTTRR